MGRRPIREWQVRRSPPFPTVPEGTVVLCGISRPFGLLSPAPGHVIYVLLTRAPLTHRSEFVRLACVKPAASVRSEPGSNSPVESGFASSMTSSFFVLKTYSKACRYSVFKDRLVNRSEASCDASCRAEAHLIGRLCCCQPVKFFFFEADSRCAERVSRCSGGGIY